MLVILHCAFKQPLRQLLWRGPLQFRAGSLARFRQTHRGNGARHVPNFRSVWCHSRRQRLSRCVESCYHRTCADNREYGRPPSRLPYTLPRSAIFVVCFCRWILLLAHSPDSATPWRNLRRVVLAKVKVVSWCGYGTAGQIRGISEITLVLSIGLGSYCLAHYALAPRERTGRNAN